MSYFTVRNLFAMEDRVLRMPGLYTLWTAIFVSNLAALGSDATTGASRDFNLYTSVLSTFYISVSSYNTIYGNKKPSSMLMIAGPIHQYTYWLMLAYYQGHVYGSHPVGVMNVVNTVLVSLFNLDLVVKTWLLAVNPGTYTQYLEDEPESSLDIELAHNEVAIQSV
jgi:hypothetical protein